MCTLILKIWIIKALELRGGMGRVVRVEGCQGPGFAFKTWDWQKMKKKKALELMGCLIWNFLFAEILQLLLGYLPCDRSLWSSELAKKRSQYKHFKEELLMNPVSSSLPFYQWLIILISSFSVLYSKLTKESLVQ